MPLRAVPSFRTQYRSSGKVEWGLFIPFLLVTLAVGLGATALMYFARKHGLHFVVITPALVVLPAAGALRAAAYYGRCRNGALISGLAGALALLVVVGHYHARMIDQIGWQVAHRLDLAPGWLWNELENQQLGRGGVGPNTFNALLGVFLLVVEGAVTWVLASAIALETPAYSESRRAWTRRVKLPVAPAVLEPLLAGLEAGSAAEVLAAVEPIKAKMPDFLELTVEYPPPHLPIHGEADPVYLTVKAFEYGKGMDKPILTVVADRWSLEPDEVAALARLVPHLADLSEPPAVAL